YGWMILSPSAGGMVNLPPLTIVPVGAVVIEVRWQFEQPMLVNRLEPVIASGVAAATASREGALVARMKRAKSSTSSPKGNPALGGSSGSGTVSNAATETPLLVFSAGWSGLVMPISFR